MRNRVADYFFTEQSFPAFYSVFFVEINRISASVRPAFSFNTFLYASLLNSG